MRRTARILLSVITVITGVLGFIVDWNESHVFNPDWTPHARLHDVIYLVLLVGVMLVTLWLMWRRSAEPSVGIRATSLLLLFTYGAFYFAILVPGTSLAANVDDPPPPQLLGIPLYPNIVVVTINVALILLADWLYHRGRTTAREP